MQAQVWQARPPRLTAPAFTRNADFITLAEGTQDLVAVLDAAGRRLYANPNLRQLLPGTLTLTGSDYFAHVHPEDRSGIRKMLMRVLTDGRSREARYRTVDRSGRVIMLAARASVARDGDQGAPRLLVVSREQSIRVS